MTAQWRVVLGLVLAWGALALVGCAGTSELSEQRAAVVSAALSQMGTPYRYGGNEPGRGLDCSGLTYYAHSAAGVKIPRSSWDQRRDARPVSAQSPRPGDMVFFLTGPKDHHVGLMVDSERFVHASSSSRRVKLAKLQTPYWRSHFVGAGTYLE
jgi:cell wall-associated NlpC family hydrolase